jgi:Sap, sulfolipid-1-addressing protein
MWGTVLFFALFCAAEPTRIGVAAVLVGLPRPFHNLLAFWIGLLISGGALALTALFLLNDYAVQIDHVVRSAMANPAVPPTKIALGALAIAVAAMLVVRARVRQTAAVPVPVGGPSGLELQPKKSRVSWAALVEGGSVGMAFVAGLATSAPPVEFWGAVLAILASGAAAGTQVSAVVVFMLVGYVIAEVPLICYLAAPAKTRATVTQLHGWLRANARAVFLGFLSVFGVIMIAGGLGGL